MATPAQAPYEYRGLIPESWDVFRANAPRWPDVSFYRDVVLTSGQPALDVGCATGRLMLGYLEQGIDIDAVDVSPEMLEIVRRNAAERALDVSNRYFSRGWLSSRFRGAIGLSSCPPVPSNC